jgi:hypothetical protein
MAVANRSGSTGAPNGDRRSAGGGNMKYQARHDLRDEVVDVAVGAAILLVFTFFALVAVRFTLS